MYCKKCGAEIHDDSTYCPQCGTHTMNTAQKPKENQMKNYSLIIGISGSIISFYSIIHTSMRIVPSTFITIGVLFSFISAYGVYRLYKNEKYGNELIILSIIIMFCAGRNWIILGVLFLIISILMNYIENENQK